MHIRDLRNMPNEALKTKLHEVQFDLGIEKRKIAATGVSSKKVKVRELKKTVAKILTILNERERKQKGVKK